MAPPQTAISFSRPGTGEPLARRWAPENFWVPGSLLVGILVGLALSSQDTDPGVRFSNILGWTYFCAWSISFYPQLFLNWKRKSVIGLSLEFQMLNLVGFGLYFIFNALLFWQPSIKEAYKEKHGGQSSAVALNDVDFSGHAFLITAVTLDLVLL
ncbi:unnamed protein product [Polarella glacialis]|uniref:Uncharacterized protein n=1 Tax=Polarella glacialis TaxID=89957 RepID=A0A813LWC2_POLGL|nr:unnamed protein product [Polarella glacialis]